MGNKTLPGVFCPVHPHARGDNQTDALTGGGAAGSPPRPWGQFEDGAVHVRADRFTPTPVGTMLSNS